MAKSEGQPAVGRIACWRPRVQRRAALLALQVASTTVSGELSAGVSYQWSETDTTSSSQTYSTSVTSSLSVVVKVAANEITYMSVYQGAGVMPDDTPYNVRQHSAMGLCCVACTPAVAELLQELVRQHCTRGCTCGHDVGALAP